MSNSKDLLVSIREGERRKGLQDQELRLGTLPTEKALGIHCNIDKNKLGFDDIAEYYWIDSKVVIGYLRNTQKRFKVFVANQVQQI